MRLLVLLAVVTAACSGGDDSGPEVVTDDEGAVRVTAPEGWDDVNGTPFERENGESLPRLEAAPDLAAYRDHRDAKGMEIVFAEELTSEHFEALLDEITDRTDAERLCGSTRTDDYDRRGYRGEVRVHARCGEAKRPLWVLAATVPRRDGVVVVVLQGATSAERATVLDSLAVLPAA